MGMRNDVLARIILKDSLKAGLIFSLTVYAFVRLIVYDVPFSVSEEISIILHAVVMGCLSMYLVAVIISFLCYGKKTTLLLLMPFRFINTRAKKIIILSAIILAFLAY